MPTDLPERQEPKRAPFAEGWISGFCWGTLAGVLAVALLIVLMYTTP